MSDEKNETVADIVADIRAQNQGLPEDSYALSPLVCDLLSFADRIEAAANRQFREVAKMIPHEEVAVSKMETTTPTGNSAAMREALMETKSTIATCMEILNKIPDGCDYDGLVDAVADELCDLRESHVKTALSAPPRNCDRYTLSEALSKYGFPTKSKPYGEKEWLDFCEWYISEAKGVAK